MTPPRVGVHTAAAIAGVKPGTVRGWLSRGCIRRHKDGIDQVELLAWLDRRNEGKAVGAVRATAARLAKANEPPTVL